MVCGPMQVTRIARAGYPTRYLHKQFAERYHVLLHGAGAGAHRRSALLLHLSILCFQTLICLNARNWERSCNMEVPVCSSQLMRCGLDI